MTEKPTFDPARSAAVRQLLIENVNAEPRRRSRHLKALLAGLIVTGIVASGTTAIALNRVALFGPDAPAVTAAPTATSSPTQTPTPTTGPPTPVPPSIAVSSTPVSPRDVDALPAQPSWSVELPGIGDGCRGVRQFTVSDGFALFQVGPILHDEFESPCDESRNSVTLTLVNTDTGQVVWTREWEASITMPSKWGSEAVILGTSGRVLIDEVAVESGNAEVLDIATGASLATVALAGDSETTYDVHAIAGDSGDVYASFADLGADGNPLETGTIRRFDPLDALHPIWSTPVTGGATMQEVTNGLAFTSVSSYGATGASNAVLDLTTGALSPRDEYVDYRFYTGYTVRASDPDPEQPQPRILTGLDDEGNQLWTRSESSGTTLGEVLTPDIRPGALGYTGTRAGTGQFATISPSAITMVDGATGTTLWSSGDAAACGFGTVSAYAQPDLRVSPQDDSVITTAPDGTTCRFDLQSGARGPDPQRAFDSATAFGQRLDYIISEGTVTAFDGESGAAVWSFDSPASQIFFAGGRLLTLDGYTLSSVG